MNLFKKKTELDLPTAEWLSDHIVPHSTPDIAALERREWQLMFVYDEMMSALPFNGLLKDHARLLGTAFTHTRFTLWKTLCDGLNSAVALSPPDKDFVTAPARPIMGEIYAVRPYQFLKLDNHKGNGMMFNRKRVNLIIPYREQIVDPKKDIVLMDEPRTARVSAWMYVGEPAYHPIDGGMYYQSVARYVPNNPKFWDLEYYYFGPKELDGL